MKEYHQLIQKGLKKKQLRECESGKGREGADSYNIALLCFLAFVTIETKGNRKTLMKRIR